METEALNIESDFDYLLGFLPDGWREKAKELGALRRCRKIQNAEVLLRVLLLHLAEGCSLRETSALARSGGLVNLSDVAIMDRLRQSSQWFRWMNEQIMHTWVERQPAAVLGTRWRLRVVDGTTVLEPGPTGSTWRVHYSIGLPSLACDQFLVSPHDGEGESFRRFCVRPKDLLIGDRAYGVRPGIFHVAKAQGDLLVRFAMDNLPLLTRSMKRFNLLEHLRALGPREVGDWPVRLEWNGNKLNGRVCAVRKSRQAAEQARKDVIRQGQKNGCTPKPSTLEAAGFIFIFTTLEREEIRGRDILEMYRGRWQIELVFKRLKSLLELGHLRKTDEEAARAWLHGKLFVAFLVEMLMRRGEVFFPWGYPLHETSGAQPLPVA